MSYLLVLLALLLTTPAWASQPIVLVGQTSAEFEMVITAADGDALTQLTVDDLELKIRCDGDSSITTINEADGNFLFQEQPGSTGNYRIRFNPAGQSIGQTVGINCYAHAEGVGDMGGIIGATKKVLESIPPTKVGAVVSSGDCTNTATTFDTTLTESSATHWNDAFLTFTTGTLAGQTKVVTGYSGTTKCITVRSPGFTGAPSATDAFILINK